MRKIILPIILLVITASYSQKLSGKVPGLTISKPEYSMNDSIIRVVYKTPRLNSTKKPAVYINGTLVKEINLLTINPNEIESINIEKEEIEIDTIKYGEKIFIKTKDSYRYNPRYLISLNNLKSKYLKSLKGPVIFQIEEEKILDDYDQYQVDEKYILKLVVEHFENKKEKLNLHTVKIILKTEENVKKANEIIIRGEN
ncbi:MAG: hypothetical protein RLZZ323_1303 [Bacteroidota bacterium]|jgi:hypothetical protein